MKKTGKLLLVLLALALCMSMLVSGCRSADKSEDPINGAPPGDEDPINGTPPGDEDPANTPVNLYEAKSLADLSKTFSIYTIEMDEKNSFSFRSEGSDEYGDKLVLDNFQSPITLWMQDGIITKTEPEAWEATLLNTDGEGIFSGMFGPMFIFNSLHQDSIANPDEWVEIEAGPSEVRDLVHMTVPVQNYSVTMLIPTTGQELWTLEYWIGNVAGYDMTIEWVMNQDNDSFRYKITELQLAD